MNRHSLIRSYFKSRCLSILLLAMMMPASMYGAEVREEGGILESSPSRDRVQVTLITAVVWEGASLRNSDLDALRLLRDRLPDQRFTHFINPAYFLRESNAHGETSPQAGAKIAAAMRPGDGVGLYLAPWKSIVTRAGVLFRDAPTFWGNTLSRSECQIDCGREVPLSVYPPDDIRKIAAASAATIEMFGFGRTKAVQVGGWMGTNGVLEQLAAIGFTTDFSSVAPLAVQSAMGRYPLYSWISDLWSDVEATAGTKLVITPQGAITTYITGGGIADQHTVAEITASFEQLIKDRSSASHGDRYFYLGMHQETAGRFAERFALALESIKALAASRNVQVTTLVPQGGNVPTAAVNVSH